MFTTIMALAKKPAKTSMHRTGPPIHTSSNNRQHKRMRKPSFFKFFLPGHTDKQLEIPNAFLKHLGGVHSGTAMLKCPSGMIWPANLVENSGVFIRGNWKRFAKEHSLQVGYCLVFRYYGRLQFGVKIFDTSACEAPVNFCSCKSYARCRQVPPPGETDKTALVKQPISKIQLSGIRKVKGEVSYFISQRRQVTGAEIERAYKAAKSFRSRKPFAMVVMRPSYVYRSFCLNLPRSFVRAELPKVSTQLTFYDPSGKEWDVRYVCSRSHAGGCISGGWSSFAVANNLEEHDVCVFELFQRNKMRVHIFRVVDEFAPLLKYYPKKHKQKPLRLC